MREVMEHGVICDTTSQDIFMKRETYGIGTDL